MKVAEHINETLSKGIDKGYKAGISAVVEKSKAYVTGKKQKPAFDKFADDPTVIDTATQTLKKKVNPLLSVDYTAIDLEALYNFKVEAFTVATIGEYDLQEQLKELAADIVENKASDTALFISEARRISDRFIRGDWLETNLNTAVSSSYRAAEWIRLNDPVIAQIYPAYIYKTRNDSRVRPEHRNLANKVFRRQDPLWRVVWPPNGWNCRCYAIPLDNDEIGDYKIEDMERSEAQTKEIIKETFTTPKDLKHFGRNSGETNSIWGKWIQEQYKDFKPATRKRIRKQVSEYAKKIKKDYK